MTWASERTVAFHHISSLVTTLLGNLAGAPAWKDSKVFPANSDWFPQIPFAGLSTPHPLPPFQVSRPACVSTSAVCRLATCSKIDWQCYTKMQIPPPSPLSAQPPDPESACRDPRKLYRRGALTSPPWTNLSSLKVVCALFLSPSDFFFFSSP